jgi:hypothetical protein
MAAQYEMCRPYEIVAEPTGIANETAYRFRIRKPVPVELQTTAGDAFHNMRSCLDSVAYELAVRHVGNLTEKQQLAAEFPIRATRSEFDDFFRERKVRQDMYGPRERDAMRTGSASWWFRAGRHHQCKDVLLDGRAGQAIGAGEQG